MWYRVDIKSCRPRKTTDELSNTATWPGQISAEPTHPTHPDKLCMMNNVITSGYIVVELKLIVRKHVLVQKPEFGTFIILGYVSF